MSKKTKTKKTDSDKSPKKEKKPKTDLIVRADVTFDELIGMALDKKIKKI